MRNAFYKNRPLHIIALILAKRKLLLHIYKLSRNNDIETIMSVVPFNNCSTRKYRDDQNRIQILPAQIYSTYLALHYF